ncbi:MAG: transposase [Elusimicrobiota bacterium]
MARGVNGGEIFITDQDRKDFLSDLKCVVDQAGAEIIAYCLMGNHFHLAIKVGAIPLWTVMQRLLTGYVLRFNARHQRTGHLFQARHKANLCLDEAYLYCLIRYIHLNPVRAGLVAAPEEWRWSSFSRHSENHADLEDFDPWPRASARKPALIREEPRPKQELVALSQSIALREGVCIEAVRSNTKVPCVVSVRRMIALEALKAGHTLTATAGWLGLNVSAVSRYSRERIARSQGLTPS